MDREAPLQCWKSRVYLTTNTVFESVGNQIVWRPSYLYQEDTYHGKKIHPCVNPTHAISPSKNQISCNMHFQPFSVHHYSDIIMGVSNHQPNDCLLSRLFRRRLRLNKTAQLRVTGLCVGNSPVTGEFPTQMASNEENVSIWWRQHIHLTSIPEHRFAIWLNSLPFSNINTTFTGSKPSLGQIVRDWQSASPPIIANYAETC